MLVLWRLITIERFRIDERIAVSFLRVMNLRPLNLRTVHAPARGLGPMTPTRCRPPRCRTPEMRADRGRRRKARGTRLPEAGATETVSGGCRRPPRSSRDQEDPGIYCRRRRT